jgi:adenine-specific DNA-methyltransferase
VQEKFPNGLNALHDILYKNSPSALYSSMQQEDIFDSGHIRLSKEKIDTVLDKILEAGIRLGEIANINCGYFTSIDRITPKLKQGYFNNNDDVEIGDGVYVITEAEREKYLNNINSLEKDRILPSFKNSDINRYCCNTTNTSWLIDLFYPADRDLDVSKIPNIFKYVSRYEEVLKSRSQINANGLNKGIAKGYWWMAAVRRRLDYTQPKIVSPQRSKRNTFAYNNVPWYASSDVYFITNSSKEYSLMFLLGILNSKIIYVWLYNRGKKKGEMLELYQQPLSQIPIPLITPDNTEYVSEVERLVNEILSVKEEDKDADVKDLEAAIDKLVFNIYHITEEEIVLIEENVK